MTQTDRIIAILRKEGQIDNYRCLAERITYRLAARVNDLRKKGWIIETKEREDRNTIYKLVSEPAPQQLTIT